MLLKVKDVEKHFGGIRVLEKINMSVEKERLLLSLDPMERAKRPCSTSLQGV